MDSEVVVALIVCALLLGYTWGHASGKRSTADALANPPAPPNLAVLEEVRSILARDGKIAAIKAYRERTGVGLRDAKLAVETLES